MFTLTTSLISFPISQNRVSCWWTSRALSTSKLVGHTSDSSSTSSASFASSILTIWTLVSAKIPESLTLPPLVDNSVSISNKTAAFSSAGTWSSLMVFSSSLLERSLKGSLPLLPPLKFQSLGKQFLTVVSDMSEQEGCDNFMTSRIDVAGKTFCVSLWMIFPRYFALRDLITPWSMGCVFDVVFGGRNASLAAFKPLIFGCTGQVSTMRATLQLSLSNFFTKGLYTFIKKQAIRPTFSLCSITKRKIFNIFETLWFLWLTDYEHQYLLFCRTCSCFSFQPRDISFQEAAILGATDSDWPVTFLNKVLQRLFQT